MLARTLAAVRAPKRGSAASEPSRAAVSSSAMVSMCRVSWIWRTLETPRPGSCSISTSPGGTSARSSSSIGLRPDDAELLHHLQRGGPDAFGRREGSHPPVRRSRCRGGRPSSGPHRGRRGRGRRSPPSVQGATRSARGSPRRHPCRSCSSDLPCGPEGQFQQFVSCPRVNAGRRRRRRGAPAKSSAVPSARVNDGGRVPARRRRRSRVDAACTPKMPST